MGLVPGGITGSARSASASGLDGGFSPDFETFGGGREGEGSVVRLSDALDDGEAEADARLVAAYSLGAGGPILKPDVDAFVITPVSPHGLTHRPVVVRDTVEIEVRVKTEQEEAYLSLDGQVGMPVRDGDIVRCGKARHPARLLRFQKTFFEVLSTKLKWGDR